MNAEREIVLRSRFSQGFPCGYHDISEWIKTPRTIWYGQDGLLAFRSWILDYRCLRVAVESTGNYWYPIFCILEGHVEFILANAFQDGNIEGKKTDRLDSERIAIYCLNDPIKPSRINPKDYRVVLKTCQI
jgi:transposase